MRKVLINNPAIALCCALVLLRTAQAAMAESAAEIAKRMYNSFDLSEVMFPLRQALKEHPKDPELHYLMGKMYSERCGSQLRAVKEFQLALKYGPNAPFAKDCKGRIAKWNAEVSKKGQKFAWSNLDCWFDDYYKKNEYHSYDPDPQPDWAKKIEGRKEWKVDVHLISCFFRHPFFDGKQVKPQESNWHSGFMTAFHDAWEKRAKGAQIEGSADMYCAVDNDGVIHPIIFHLSGGDAFKKLLLATFKSLDSCPSLMLAAKSNAVFKARIACRNAYELSGTWYAFTSQGGPVAPVKVTFGAVGDIDKNGKPQINGTGLIYERVEPMEPAKPALLLRPKTPALKAKEQASIKQAKLAMEHGVFENAYDALWPLVENDNAEACYLMATALASPGNSHPQPRVAEVFMQKAVDLGDSTAVNQLLDSIEFGNAQISMEKGVEMCKKFADKGLSSCQFRIGRYLEFGDTVEQDKELALKYYKLAATAGDADAKSAIARLSAK